MSGGVLVMAGGTGGHVQPALAVAALLRGRGIGIDWLGTARGIEARLVPAAGHPLHHIEVHGLRGGGVGGWIAAPAMVWRALRQALALMRALRPAVALGMGGYACGPGGLAARLCRVPLVLHEQNAVAGMTNRLLAPLATRVTEAFAGSFAARREALLVGNPVRPEIVAIEPPRQRLECRGGPLRVLAIGGSQGARFLNLALPPAVARCAGRGVALEVRHQAGAAQIDAARAAWREAGLACSAEAYIEDMASAYRWADVVLSRAGAMTVCEIAAAGVASVLVPFPHAVDDHQTRNAMRLVERGAALLLPQHRLDAAALGTALESLAGDRGRVLGMAEAARGVAVPDAAARVADLVQEFCDG